LLIYSVFISTFLRLYNYIFACNILIYLIVLQKKQLGSHHSDHKAYIVCSSILDLLYLTVIIKFCMNTLCVSASDVWRALWNFMPACFSSLSCTSGLDHEDIANSWHVLFDIIEKQFAQLLRDFFFLGIPSLTWYFDGKSTLDLFDTCV